MTEYLVVISEERRYSIWPAFRAIPWGWTATGFRGAREECLAHIASVWTDLRPQASA